MNTRPKIGTPVHLDELSERNRTFALDGYEMFFQGFVMDNPITYITLDNFCQKHFGNPDLLDEPAIVAYADGKPIAAQFYLGTPLLHDGRELVCAQAADTAAAKQGRGLPFLRMFVEGDRIQKAAGVPLRIGTPNENSYPVVTKLNDRHIGDFSLLALDMHGLKVLPPTAELRVRVTHEYPFTDADLVAINAPSARIKTKKTHASYAWKLACLQPRVSMRFYRVLAGTSLVGYFIVREEPHNQGIICDWDILASGKENSPAFAPADVVAAFLREAGARFDRLTMPCMNLESPECAVIQSLGFAPVAGADGLLRDPFCVTPYADNLDPVFLDFEAWQLRMLDLDYSLNCYQTL